MKIERNPVLLLAALALPILGLATSWGLTHQKAQQGTDWDVPVRGYDPRDLLRGHYISYRYDWPALKADDDRGWLETLCIKGAPPVITSVTRVEGEPPKDCTSIARASSGVRSEIDGLSSGILYVAQTKALDLERNLGDPKLQGFIRIRVREDGVVTPQRMTFRARPAEDAQEAGAR